MGKIAPFLLIGFFELSVMLLAMVVVFEVPIHGSVGALLLLSVPYILVALAYGTLISTRARSQSEAMQSAFMIFIPSVFLSGYVFPLETMPVFFRWVSYTVPATYYINIARGIILRGAGLRHLWVDGVVLFVMSAAMLLLAAMRFQKKVVTQ